MDTPTELRSIYGAGGEKCDLHFIVENEVVQTKKRVDKLEEKTVNSYDQFNSTINDLVVQMRTYMGQQEYRDTAQQDLKVTTNKNVGEINDLKSSIKSVENQNRGVVDAIGKLENTISGLAVDMKDMDRKVLGKEQITEIVTNAIVADKNSGREQWFQSLPAKVSAGAAVLTFISYFTVKIVIMLLAI